MWEGTFLGRPVIVKQRFSKKYRHPQLDAKLTVARLKQAGRGWGSTPQCRLPACSAVLGSSRTQCYQHYVQRDQRKWRHAPRLPTLQEARSMMRARKLGVHTPGAPGRSSSSSRI